MMEQIRLMMLMLIALFLSAAPWFFVAWCVSALFGESFL